MKTSLIITVLNEEDSINDLLESIIWQTVLPTEVVICDGGSADKTKELIIEFIKQKSSKTDFKIVTKKGNRSVGRNYAIEKSSHDIILITDAGNILDKNWVKEIIKPFSEKSVDVVSGYYQGKAQNNFQKSLIPYVLVMPDVVDPHTFLPATRSMAARKNVLKEIGGFDERYSHNEDYVLARRIRSRGKKIVFEKDAIAHWIPRADLRQAYTMFYRFAYGDIEAGIVRPKVTFLLMRYLTGLLLLVYTFVTREYLLIISLGMVVIFYLLWAIYKNYKYVKSLSALFWLPLIQITADVSVMHGTINAWRKR